MTGCRTVAQALRTADLLMEQYTAERAVIVREGETLAA
jgi:hypothetical protein